MPNSIIPSNALSRVTDDKRQTDHVIEKCVEIAGIACAAKARTIATPLDKNTEI